MYALITGASGGLGHAFAHQLAAKGYNLALTGRNRQKLEALQARLLEQYPNCNILLFCMDLSGRDACYSLHRQVKDLPIQILINNAGFGKIGLSASLSLEDELCSIDTNLVAVHLLTRLFLGTMQEGYILNVGSAAGLLPAPLMACYGAAKSYVVHYSSLLQYELKHAGSKVNVCVLCPGPVNTGFNKTAGAAPFGKRTLSAQKCAEKALSGMFKGKTMIIPTLGLKIACVTARLLPTALLYPVQFYIQNRKLER